MRERIAVGFIKCLERLELDTAERLGAALGMLCYYMGLRRKIVAQQLRRCLGHLPLRQRRAAGRLCYANAGANLLNIFATKDPQQPFGPRWKKLNPRWSALMGKTYKSAVYVSPHLGAYEVNAWMTIQDLQQESMFCYVRIQKDAAVDEIVNKHRRLCGADVLFVRDEDKGSVLKTYAALKKGRRSLNILADQGPRKIHGRPAFFLGQATYCHHGPFVFAKRAKIPIIPCLTLRTGVAEFRYLCGRPIDCTGRDVDEIMQLYLDQLSAMIAAHPGQYFWHHRRFKHLADLEVRAQEPWRTQGLRLLVDNP